MHSTYNNLKASICDCCNRTLKNKMWMQFSLRGKYKWLDILLDLLAAYNRSKHRATGIRPKDVNFTNKASVLAKFNQKSKLDKKAKFKVGDKV